jgi:hypothetical protein
MNPLALILFLDPRAMVTLAACFDAALRKVLRRNVKRYYRSDFQKIPQRATPRKSVSARTGVRRAGKRLTDDLR